MSRHSELAKELFEQGYNCCQSVVLAFCDEIGMDKETALKISSSFGGGMGRLREVCGAVSGMFMILGLIDGYSDPADKEGKTNHYKLIQDKAEIFKNKNGSIICRELTGLESGKDRYVPADRTEQYYQTRPCSHLVEHAAEILDEYLEMNRDSGR